MIFLTPFVDRALLEEIFSNRTVKLDVPKAAVLENMEAIWGLAGLGDTHTHVAVGRARDEAGRIFSDLQVKITGRFAIDGYRYLAAGELAVDLDALLDTFHEIYAYAEGRA